MTHSYLNSIRFSSVQRCKVETAFSGGAITGNEGIPMLAEVDRQLGLTRSVLRHLRTNRTSGKLRVVLTIRQLTESIQALYLCKRPSPSDNVHRSDTQA